ncbi:hypothetical protein PIB30_006303 [Stylosanthes scabra]|uniref:Uncharacterized protein n=1 Tax=Stylosanthes scabra TaxID=79078 RepID=A0ABU6R4M1_9FABA|nr:hypothetical protein [Stylosanthes scabra]
MFRRLRWFVGLNQKNLSTKRLGNVEHQPGPERPNQLPVLDAVHEVAVYIHRWYKIKVTLRWEVGEDSYPGIPAGVVQYEAPEVGSDNLCRVWMIDDADNSFSTPPFRIKYARQDVLLSIMISFYLSFGACEVRVPSVHISLLKASHHTSRSKVSSDSRDSEGTYVEDYVGSNKVTLIKALMTAHDILLEDLKRISTGIGQAVDLTEITCASDVSEWFSSTPPANVNGDSSPQLSDRAHKTAHSINKLTDLFSWDDHLSSSLSSL